MIRIKRDYSEYPLHEAAVAGDAFRVSQLVANGGDVNARTRKGETPLMAAAARGRLEVVEALLAVKPKLDLKDRASAVGEGRQTALHCAVDIGNYRVVRRLLEAGAQVDPVSQRGYTPLVLACYAGNLDLVQLLLHHGANPNGCDPRQTPLNGACTKSSVALFEKRLHLLEPLRQVIRELLAHGADPNLQGDDGESPLHSTSDAAVARELVTAGANVNARNPNGETPLITHAMAGSVELLRCLVQCGADVNARSTEGATALRRIFDRRPPEPEVAELLVAAGGDVNEVDGWGFSLLDHYARLFGEIVRGREADPMRAQYYKDDFVQERAQLIEFMRATGARLVRQCQPPTSERNKGDR